MIEIEIEPVWRFRRRKDAQSLQIMLDFLAEIRASGKIAAAAGRAGVSYRHAWNLIEKWSEFFNTPLVVRRQGSGTRLTPFGEK
ncbi:LysR family transcriptional regulator, partial [Aquamicrobium sp.]